MQHPVTIGTFDQIILRMKTNKMGAKRIAERLGCSVEIVIARVQVMREESGVGRRPQCKLTPVSAGQCDDVIKRMRAEGRTLPEIGLALGCSDRVVGGRIAWLREAGELPKGEPKAEAVAIKRTPQLDALFTKAVTHDIPDARLRELFRCDDGAIRDWKRVLKLNLTKEKHHEH